MIYGFVLY